MTTVTLLSPERASTGTQLLVEDEGARLLFDCGLVFSPATNPFAHVDRRPGRELADLIRLGRAQYVPGLYAPQYLSGCDFPSFVPPSDGPMAVALSHSHLDHSALAGFVDPSVPIYASPPAARIIRALSDAGATAAPVDRTITAVEWGEPFAVGPMRVRLLPVDHDVGGASGMLIETSDGVISYTGDIRLHGLHPERSLAFARTAREAGVRLHITEGNRLYPPPEPGAPPPLPERVEADVSPTVARILRDVPNGLGVILLTPENGERVENVAQAAASAGRLFVADLDRLARAVAALCQAPDAPYAVYLPPDLEAALRHPEDLPASLREVLPLAGQFVTPQEIASNPGGFLLQLPFERFADLLDMVPAGSGGGVITSNGPPLGPFDPAYPHMLWWAEHLGMQVSDAGSTGHAAPRDLALVALHTGAPVVMSVHSAHPELLPIPPDRLLLPARGRPYDLAELPLHVPV